MPDCRASHTWRRKVLLEEGLPQAVRAVCSTLEMGGYAAYVVGGGVRDLLLGRMPEDWDVCTSARPEQIQTLFSKTVPTGVRHGTITVLSDGLPIEVTAFRAEQGYSDGRHPDTVRFGVSLEEDLARRDFTIGAMAFRPATGVLSDPFHGRRDLQERRIRCVGEPIQRFLEDSLRIFRAVRFSAQLGFSIEPETLDGLFSCAGQTRKLSGERVKAELQKLLLSDEPERVELLLRCGALKPWGGSVIPENWAGLKQAPADPVHRWRAFCKLAHFPADTLPMERTLRRGILHPEDEVRKQLAVTGGELYDLGLRGPEISAAQRRLTQYVMEHPEENRRERLLTLLDQTKEVHNE